MTRALNHRLAHLSQIEQLYAERGGFSYGEGVTQLEHALQCAVLAQAQDASPSLIAAALLHDIGHLFAAQNDTEVDLRHQRVGADALAGLFDDAVCQPIALHVCAKRYLCWRDAGYFEALSPASQASLALQGGTFDMAQAMAFENLPRWRDAVALRRFDDMGKSDEISDRAFADFVPLLRGLLINGAAL